MTANERGALRARGLSVDYPLPEGKPHPGWLVSLARVKHFRALADVELEVRSGELVGVLGHNGAGKSTLLRTLGGVLSPSAGTVESATIPGALFELGGYGNVHLSGRRYAERWLDLQGVPRRRWAELIADILEFSELGDRFDDPVRTYSAGMGARLYFAVATSVRRDVYLIDEILAVGDQHFQAKCWARMRRLLSQDVCGVLVTHDWSAVLRLCERSLELKHGRVVQAGPSEQVVRRYLGLAEQKFPRRVRFTDDLPSRLHVSPTAAEPVHLAIPVQSDLDQPVRFGFSIERLVAGSDWQVLVLGPPKEVFSSSGRVLIDLSFESLPLWAGRYRLALFLTTAGEPGAAPIVQDQRSWTSGNGIELVIEGRTGDGVAAVEFEFSIVGRA